MKRVLPHPDEKDNRFDNPSTSLNLVCLLAPTAAYYIVGYIGSSLAGLRILGFWALYILTIPLLGLGALFFVFNKQNSRRIRFAAFSLFVGECALATIIWLTMVASWR